MEFLLNSSSFFFNSSILISASVLSLSASNSFCGTLNKVLKWIRYPLPNKIDLIKRIHDATIFSKFDMKSGYYQISVKEKDKYKTAFVVPFGYYE